MVARHKLVKAMDLGAQLDEDDALSDGGEDYITPEQQALLNDGLDQVREVIGGADNSGLSDTAIKDVLWDCHFDIEETLQWALEEQEKNRQAQERRAPYSMKDLPPLPEPRELGYGEYSAPSLAPRHVPEAEEAEQEERSRVPLIVLAQQQYDTGGLESEAEGAPVKRNLSTITERTERTEISPPWPARQFLPLNIPRAPSSVTTSYGRAVEQPPDDSAANNSMDPDLIPVSPSGSAVHRLSFYEPAPSLPPSETDSYSSYQSPRAPSEPVPPLDTIPDIPDLNSKSSRQKPTSQPAKKSKLAMLANSRATTSSARSESSRSSGTDVLGSVKTYPTLRPTSQSIRPPSSSVSTTPSSMSSHVRRAIQTALQLEAGDHDPTPEVEASERSKTPTPTLDRPAAPTPSKVPEMPTPSSSPPTARQPSKLALLAQANKAARIAKPQTPTWSPPPRLPEERTEYLTPIANGSTVTTAITTSYQSLYSLTDAGRPSVSSIPYVVPLPTPASVGSGDAKKSKLAMKIKKAQEKQQPSPVAPEAPPPPPIPPMFLPKANRTRASPSAFASLLVDDAMPSGTADAEARRSAQLKKLKGKEPAARHAHRSQRNHPTQVPDLFEAGGFAFDGPSPDDIVLNARRDTSLAQSRKVPPSTSFTKPFISKI
ncbi:hypothetical protein C8R46DRAFT_1211987 [Mycena filopes]|nr:hypothetical protein C8R46DRAFT_1211987 [Mycena filopes]